MSKRSSSPPTNKGGQKKPRLDDSENDNSLSTVPIFLKKLAKMIETCDPSICAWSEAGDMFVVKNPDRFAEVVIPQYFDHNSELTVLPLLNVVYVCWRILNSATPPYFIQNSPPLPDS
jgi:hypothetical protein